MAKYLQDSQFEGNIKVDFWEKLRGFDAANKNSILLYYGRGMNKKICRELVEAFINPRSPLTEGC